MEPNRIHEVEHHIKEWARARRSTIRLRSYMWEIDTWRAATGVQSVPSMLEVGCGSGIFLATCVALALTDRAVGVDPTIEAHGTAAKEMAASKALVERLQLDVRLRQASLDDLLNAERDQERYAVVVFRGSLHHIYERDDDPAEDAKVVERCVEDLASIRRQLLEPSGYIWLAEFIRPTALYGRLYNLYSHAIGHSTFNWSAKRSPEEWSQILVAAGYKPFLSAPLPINVLVGTPFARNVGTALSNVSLIGARC